jgi:hypothetical protein
VAKGTQAKDFLWYLVIAVVTFPLVPLLDRVGRPEMEWPAYLALSMILLAIKVCRDIRGRWWFWVTIVAVAALHVPLLIHTAKRLSGISVRGMLVLGILDILIILAVISLVERLVGTKDSSGQEPSAL